MKKWGVGLREPAGYEQRAALFTAAEYAAKSAIKSVNARPRSWMGPKNPFTYAE